MHGCVEALEAWGQYGLCLHASDASMPETGTGPGTGDAVSHRDTLNDKRE
jgi:hypothetical protein